MVRYYNPHESAIISLFRWRFTLTSSVFRMGEFWLYMICALVVMVLMDRGVVDLPLGVINLDVWKLLGPQLSVTIFAVVFYNNQCYARYMSLYSSCVDIDVNAKNLVSELLVDFGHDPELHSNIRQACKYSLAAIFYFYLSMEDAPGMLMTWQVIKDKGLLTEAEIQRVHDYPGTVFMLLLHWASIAVKENIKRLRGKVGQPGGYSPPELAAMSSRIYVLVDRIGVSCLTVRSIQNMPVPFSYFHLLNILISLTVLATGIGSLILVEQHDSPSYCLAFFPYSVVTFVLLALRQLSGELADPFGEDDLDFPIADFMRHIYDNVVAMLAMYERYNVLEALKMGPNTEFTPGMVKRPCKGEDRDNKDLSGILQRQASRIPAAKSSGKRASVAQWLLLDDGEDEISAYGPRNWVKPEDWKGAAKLVRWLGPSGEVKADTIGMTMDEKLDDVVPVKDKEPEVDAEKAPPKAEANNKEAAKAPKDDKEMQDGKCLESLQRIEKQMTQLVTVMSELAANMKDAAPSDRRPKAERNDKASEKPKSRSRKNGEEKLEE